MSPSWVAASASGKDSSVPMAALGAPKGSFATLRTRLEDLVMRLSGSMLLPAVVASAGS
jgi:hypothetical protein